MRDAAGDEQYRIDYDSGRGWLWCDRYGNSGGDNIDLVSEIDGKTGYADAVYRLLGAPTARDLPRPVQRPQIERKPPQLPDYSRDDVIYGRAYLGQRGIDADVVQRAERAGVLAYGRGAVYFVGRDKKGDVRSVTERSYERHGRALEGGYKRDLRGSEKRYAPVLPGDDTRRIFVVEGGADALAVQTIYSMQDKPAPTVIITGGAGARAWIDEHKELLASAEKVVVMRDREKDPATQERTDAQHAEQERRIREIAPGADVSAKMPPEGYKDVAEMARAQMEALEARGEVQIEYERGYGR